MRSIDLCVCGGDLFESVFMGIYSCKVVTSNLGNVGVCIVSRWDDLRTFKKLRRMVTEFMESG